MFELQGHRGARGLWPENTLAGFVRTVALGVGTLELDCGMTRDGMLVVTHDPELNPDCTRDAHGRFLAAPGPAVVALDYAELAQYDVGRLRPGSAYAARFPEQQPIDGERIPRLGAVLELARAHPGVRLAIEVKTFPEEPARTAPPASFARALRAELERTGSAAQVCIMAFDWRVIRAAQALMPHVPTVALTGEQAGFDTVRLGASPPSPWLSGLDPARFDSSVVRLVAASGARTWGPDFRDLDAQRVAAAHGLGLRVVPWTVNDPADAVRLLDFGVDGMASDRPDVLRNVLAGRIAGAVP